jgi:hypothetical protein
MAAASGATMIELDPFEKISETARALHRTDDPLLHAKLGKIRDLWITVANEGDFLAASQLVKEVRYAARPVAGRRPHPQYWRCSSVDVPSDDFLHDSLL